MRKQVMRKWVEVVISAMAVMSFFVICGESQDIVVDIISHIVAFATLGFATYMLNNYGR